MSAVADHPWLAELTVDGVLQVPEHALPVLGRIYGGDTGLGVIAAGALIAVMSTIAGLLLAAAASWGHDVYERHINPRATQRQAVLAGRVTTLATACAAAGLGLVMRPEAFTAATPSIVATMVTWAFAIAGSALTPVFLLAIWWPRTTAAGAVAGMSTGMVVAVSMFTAGLFAAGGLLREALVTPTLVAAPLAAAVTVIVSRRTVPPADVERSWLIMHGTAADRHAERLARLVLAENRRRRAAARAPRTARTARGVRRARG